MATTILPMTLIRSGGLPFDAWLPLACGLPDWALLQKDEHAAAAKLLKAFDDALSSLPDSPIRTAVYNTRKDFFQHRKLPSAKFQADFLSEQRLIQLLDNLRLFKEAKERTRAAETDFEHKLAANYRTLQHIACNERLCRALLFTSHDLLDRLSDFAKKPIELFDKRDRQIALSLLQYLTRAVFKTSPLGRFTTVQPLLFSNWEGNHDAYRAISANSSPQSGGVEAGVKPLVAPNVALLPAIYEILLREPAFFQSLSLSLNPCISSLSESLISEKAWLYFDGEREAFQQIEPDPVADFVVKTMLENGRQIEFQQLIARLENEVDATKEQLQNLVRHLVDIGLLEWQLPELGLAPGWCGGLYNYLGFLPSSPVLTEAAYLLQWLRTAARTLPFQPVGEAQNTQREALGEAKKFLEKHGGEIPPIRPEQVFFEDVAQDAGIELPKGVMENLIGQLADCWQQKEFHPMPLFRARLFDFATKTIPEGQSMDFLEFSKTFLENPLPESFELSGTSTPRHPGKVGALLQVFQENGEHKAVVNAMFPGGGKLFARWLPLFPLEVLEKIKTWNQTSAQREVLFPWQGWSNANFQPSFPEISLAVPDGRTRSSPGGQTILLADIAVQKDGRGFLQLIEKHSNKPIFLNDLGLEAPEARPPVMQVLWHLGVPFVSTEFLLPDGLGWEQVGEFRHRKRVEFQSLVLARAAWELPPGVWQELFLAKVGRTQAEQIGLGVAALRDLGIPKRFFGQFAIQRQKPQFYDMESPVSMLLLEKNLRGGTGNLRLTEMLPTPEQWLGERAAEFVVEFSETQAP